MVRRKWNQQVFAVDNHLYILKFVSVYEQMPYYHLDCNQRILVFDVKGRYITEMKGDLTTVHSIDNSFLSLSLFYE